MTALIEATSIVAMCSAELPLLRNGPFDYCFSPGMHPQPGSYMFSIGVDTRDLIQAVFRFLRESGITRIATITSTARSPARRTGARLPQWRGLGGC